MWIFHFPLPPFPLPVFPFPFFPSLFPIPSSISPFLFPFFPSLFPFSLSSSHFPPLFPSLYPPFPFSLSSTSFSPFPLFPSLFPYSLSFPIFLFSTLFFPQAQWKFQGPQTEKYISPAVRRSMRLGDDFDWLGGDKEAILRIRRFWRLVCGAHGCFTLPPSLVQHLRS